jgi:hypothetical protein
MGGHENAVSKAVGRKFTKGGNAAAAPIVTASNNSFRLNMNEVMCADDRFSIGTQFMVPLADTMSSRRLIDQLRIKAPHQYYVLAMTFDATVWRAMWFDFLRDELLAARLKAGLTADDYLMVSMDGLASQIDCVEVLQDMVANRIVAFCFKGGSTRCVLVLGHNLWICVCVRVAQLKWGVRKEVYFIRVIKCGDVFFGAGGRMCGGK